jgi:hypothetical protein
VVAAGGATACELQLELGSHLRGRIVDDTGRRVDHWRIVCEVADPPSFVVTDSDAAGSFVVPIWEGSRGRLLAWPPGGELAPPVRTIPAVAAGGVELMIPAASPDAGASFILRFPQWPTHYGTMSPPYADMFLFQEESGRGVAFQWDDAGALSVHGVAAGFYRIIGATLSHGFLDLGRHWHDGRSMIDLGTIELPELATVRFELPKDDKVEPELCQIRDDIDLRIAGLDLFARDGVQLPPGSYVVHWQEAGVTRRRAFTLTAGQRAVVTSDASSGK